MKSYVPSTTLHLEFLRSKGVAIIFLANLAFQNSCADSSCWQRTIFERAWTFEDVHGVSERHVFAISSQAGGVYSYDGKNWRLMPDSPTNLSIFSLSPASIYVGYSYFDGSRWSNLLENPFRISDIWAESEERVFFVGGSTSLDNGSVNARIFHCNRLNCEEIANDFHTVLQGLWGSSATDVYAVGTDEELSTSKAGMILHYDGVSWSVMKDDIPYGLFGVWGTSSTDVFAVGDNCHILHYDGIEWREMETPCQGDWIRRLESVWGASGTQVYAGGGASLYYDGNRWKDITEGVPAYVESIWGTSATNLFFVGSVFGEHYQPVGIILQYTCPEPGMLWKP